MRTRSFWGWGYEDESADPAQLAAVEAGLAGLLGMRELRPVAAPHLDEIELRAPRVRAPSTLESLVSDDRLTRASHSYGKSYRDLVRALGRDFSNPPDLVARPRDERDVLALLDWCSSAGIAAIPYGGGSSVSGGVEPSQCEAFRGTLSIDLGGLDRVLEIDRTSRSARVQGGIFGPALEDQLRPHGLSLRHYPQSFEFSTLGGWIATRSGGHFATLYTHVEELVAGLRVVTPTGTLETRRLPGSGAGPDPARWFAGSEGILGIIVEAWMRLQDRPRFRASASVAFDDFATATKALRALSQSGLYPSNCRLLDPMEALMNGAAGGGHALLLLAFESADHPLDAWLRRGAELCRDHAGRVPDSALVTRTDSQASPKDAADAWRRAFLRAPYLRDALVARGVFVETFETAVTWDRFDALHAAVLAAATEAARATGGGSALVTCRVTHVYPDGAAPYFTVIAPARRGSELEQWATVKAAVTDAMLANGGTTTHHHAVGRDFRPWYERERPDAFASALAAAKRALDPAGILNPGVLLPALHEAR